MVSEQAINSGDSDELQALFDSICSSSNESTPAAPSAAPAQMDASATMSALAESINQAQDDDPAKSMFASIGQLTRKIHDALRELGYDKSIEKAAAAIPDAKDRLSYIATLTEQAANRTLNAVDAAQPLQDKLAADSESLAMQWDKLYANQLSVEEFKQLAARTRDHLKGSTQLVNDTNAQLMEIMMAQDFQDLTGQVIKKIVTMAAEMESGLLDFLVQFQPGGPGKPVVTHTAAEFDATLLNGPVYNADGRTDVVTNQEQVDDLLASLGF